MKIFYAVRYIQTFQPDARTDINNFEYTFMYIHTYEILDVWRLWWYLFIRLSIDGHDQSQLTLFSDLHRVTDLHLQPGIVIVPIHVSSLLYCRREKKKRETKQSFHHDLLKNEFIVLIYNFNIIIYIYRIDIIFVFTK